MKVDLRCLPTEDAAFCEAAARYLEELTEEPDPSIVVDELGDRLRARYPAVLVRFGDTLAEISPQIPIVYAFRDGPVLSLEPAT